MGKQRSSLEQIAFEFKVLQVHTRLRMMEPGEIKEKRKRILAETRNTVAKVSRISNMAHKRQTEKTLLDTVSHSEAFRQGIIYKEKNRVLESSVFAGVFLLMLCAAFLLLHICLGVPVILLIPAALCAAAVAWLVSYYRLVPRKTANRFYKAASEFISGVGQEALKWESNRIKMEREECKA